jgi:hypothetical protein
MPAPKPQPDLVLLSARQFALLSALRDALMQTSLSLHDLKFELDQQARKLAQRDCDSLLQRVREHTRNRETP